MINNKEEETFKSVLNKLANDIEGLSAKVERVEKAQTEVDKSLQDFKEAKSKKTPIKLMQKETVEQTLKSITLPKASIGSDAKAKIDSLIYEVHDLCRNLATIKTRRPFIKITIYNGKRYLWIGAVMALISIFAMALTRTRYDNQIEAFQQQACFLGDRAYQAAILLDEDNPGIAYHEAISLFNEEPDKVSDYVFSKEKSADQYQKWKRFLLTVLCEKDSRDIRLIRWERNGDEWWIRYRFYDEETERSIRIWADGRAEETTDKIVTDLASAQKYSKRNIWETVRGPIGEAE